MNDRHYDLVVIGAGSGGIAMARRAAAHGARCLVIEEGRLGGTCVNRGCVPKKMLWYAAGLAEALHDAPDYGFSVQAGGFDWAAMQAAREAYIERLNGIYATMLNDSRVQLRVGQARFLSPREVSVDGDVVSASHIVIACGGRPSRPDIPGAGLGITSDDFFALREQPRRVAIVGAGYIAVELAGLLQALGSDVSLFLRRQHFLGRFDATIREALMLAMQEAGVDILSSTRLVEVSENDAGQLCLDSERGIRLEGFDTLIWAIGREHNSDRLDLDKCGLTTADDGHIPVDSLNNTAVDGIYAIGDVCGQPALTPVAIAAGRRLADRLFAGMLVEAIDNDLIATVIFSHPPVGSIGLSEEEARTRHGDAVHVYQSQFNPLYHAVTSRKVPTTVKLVTVGADERVVGCHVIGEGADEMLQGFAVAMRLGACKADFDATIAIHPTAAEELVTLR